MSKAKKQRIKATTPKREPPGVYYVVPDKRKPKMQTIPVYVVTKPKPKPRLITVTVTSKPKPKPKPRLVPITVITSDGVKEEHILKIYDGADERDKPPRRTTRK